jgi:hypothetical protein
MVITVFLRTSRWMPGECLKICHEFKRHRLCENVAKINRGVLEDLAEVSVSFYGTKKYFYNKVFKVHRMVRRVNYYKEANIYTY